MSGLPWLRLYTEFAHDPKVQTLAFEDQRHFVVLLCLKAEGALDTPYPSPERRERAIAYGLGLDTATAAEARRRLQESGLVDEAWNPVRWDARQFESDNVTARVRKFRAKHRQNRDETLRAPLLKRKRNVIDSDSDSDSDTDTEKGFQGFGGKEKSPPETLPSSRSRTSARIAILGKAESEDMKRALCARYSLEARLLLSQAFERVKSARKGGICSSSVLLRQLQYLDKHPIEAVEDGTRAFIDRDVIAGNPESYWRGCVRNAARRAEHDAETEEATG